MFQVGYKNNNHWKKIYLNIPIYSIRDDKHEVGVISRNTKSLRNLKTKLTICAVTHKKEVAIKSLLFLQQTLENNRSAITCSNML